MNEPTHRRRRRRASAEQGPPRTAPGEVDEPAVQPPKRRRTGRDTERGLRELTGAGPSQLGVDGALRARDVNRPTPDDLAAAEHEIVIVRRHWKPPDQR